MLSDLVPSISSTTSMTFVGLSLILVGLFLISRGARPESPSTASFKESRPLLFRRRNSILFSHAAGDLIMSHGKKDKLKKQTTNTYTLDKEYLVI